MPFTGAHKMMANLHIVVLLIAYWLLIGCQLFAKQECWHRRQRPWLLSSGKLRPGKPFTETVCQSCKLASTSKLWAPASGTCRASNSSSSSADQALSRTLGTASCGHLAQWPFRLCRTCFFVWAAVTQMSIKASYDLKFFNNNVLFKIIIWYYCQKTWAFAKQYATADKTVQRTRRKPVPF